MPTCMPATSLENTFHTLSSFVSNSYSSVFRQTRCFQCRESLCFKKLLFLLINKHRLFYKFTTKSSYIHSFNSSLGKNASALSRALSVPGQKKTTFSFNRQTTARRVATQLCNTTSNHWWSDHERFYLSRAGLFWHSHLAPQDTSCVRPNPFKRSALTWVLLKAIQSESIIPDDF